LAGREVDAQHHLTLAVELAAKIGKQGDRELLETDLSQLTG
jgi:hypothetical protein